MKKIHRFLLAEKIPHTGSVSIIEPEVVHIISSVLRLTATEEVICFWADSADVHLSLTEITKKTITGNVISVQENTHTVQKDIVAGVAITKNNFDTTVQKLTELGVCTIVPLITDRTIKKEIRLDRLQKISNEALEQCGGNRVVHICEPMNIQNALEKFSAYEKISFDTEQTVPSPKKYAEKTILFIGPEGGWSDAEREMLQKETIVHSLGNRILKADTAAIVAVYEMLR